MPEDGEQSGSAIMRNPGVALVWVTLDYRLMRLDNGVLFRVGVPIETRWYCEGRPATRVEVLESIQSGLPALVEVARGSTLEEIELRNHIDDALKLVPDA